MNIKSRLLGMAFASSDVLFELDGERVTFAVGAGPAAGQSPGDLWTGQALEALMTPASCARMTAALGAAVPGVRSAPIDVEVLIGDGRTRKAIAHAFALPDLAPSVSCALSWQGPAMGVTSVRPAGLLDARGLVKRLGSLLALGGTGPELAIDFVEIPGLKATDSATRRAGARIEAGLQAASLDGTGTAQLAPDRFALIRESCDLTDLAAVIRDAGRAEGLDLSPITTRGEIGKTDASVAVRTLRRALEDCLKDGASAGDRFGERLKQTVRDAESFRNIVRDRQFKLVWQPIVSMDKRDVHHFEALTRFGGAKVAPVGPIGMAEDLGLIEAFDLAVVEKALAQMRHPGFNRIKVAVNVSAMSLLTDNYVDKVLGMTASLPEVRKRLLIELTETTALTDLEGADRRLTLLRDARIRICLDDFGVGTASYDYLRRLHVDIVKIDGGFVRDVEFDPKVRTMMGHLIDLCRDMKIDTVAEMVETEGQASVLQELGVQFGQGWLFGRPSETPTIAASASAARRLGEVAGWG